MLAALATMALAPAADAASRADLRVAKLSEPPATLQSGAKLAVTDTVRNAGRAKARRTTVVYWLSKDRYKDAGDVRAARRTLKALKGRRSARGKATLTIPAALIAGSFHLVACADGAKKVKERNERNNCRASRGRLTVTALLPSGPAVPGVTPTAPAPTTPTTPTPTTPGETPDFPLDADPLTVTHTVDAARAVTQRVEPFGGTVSTTGADGTKYTLTVPNKALLSGLDITMTPVTAVNGSPLSGGLIGAVEILPHGLELMEPATLLIEPGGSAGPVAGQTGFLSHEQGEDFHLYPLEMEAALSLKLTHFSTPGVAQATDADRQVVLAHPPERHRAQYEQMMSELLRDARVKALANEETDLPIDQIAAILRGYYDDIVGPLVVKAQTDDTVATEATAELLSWARQVDLLSLHEHALLKVRRDAVMDYLKVIFENAINKGYERCVQDHDLDFIARLVGLARAAALLGLGLDEGALDKAERCGTFRLDFDARFTISTGYISNDIPPRTYDEDGAWRVRTPLPGIEIPMSGLTQAGTLGYSEASYHSVLTHPCKDAPDDRDEITLIGTTPDDEVTVLLGIDLNPREPGTPPPANRDIRVRLFGLEALKETYKEELPSWCGDTPPTPRAPWTENRWRQYLNSYHQDTLFEDWTKGAGDVVATWDHEDVNVNHGTTGAIHLVLRHVPAT